MDKTFTKRLFFLAILLFITMGAFAQTITVGSVDPGPYAPGSTVAVPISLGTTGSCLDKSSNQFQVILSNSSGSFASGTTVIGTYSGFYASFVNATLPSSLASGNYNIEVVSTSPASTSSNTASITVQAGSAVKPAITITESVAPGVYGRCVGTTSPFTVLPASGGTVTASFHNEISGGDEGTNITIPTTGYQFTPAKANYTVIAKTTSGGVVGTYGYQLINNNLLNPFSPVGQPFACMPAGGKATLNFGVAFTGAIGINNNYPGTLYTVTWGDGSTSVLNYCDIVQAGGLLSHDYTTPTCGSSTPLQVTCQPSTTYCGSITAPSTTTAKIIITPTVDFTLPAIACVGTAITVPNNSKPGPDYSTATQPNCNTQNANALYDWYFDGTLVASGVNLSYSYVIPATTAHGTHTILLHADAPADPNTPYCQAADVVKSICLETPPQPAFTIPSPVCVTGGSVSVNNSSTVDSAPCSSMVYTWSVTPSTYSFTGGTNQNSVSPQFSFSAPGTYTIKLNINDAANTSCASASTTQTIIVQSTPVATLSPDVSLCGNNQTLTFDGTSGSPTKVIFTGAVSTDSYAWTVSPPAGGNAVFAGGTSASSTYPQITFNGYGTYTINVTHTNVCGSVSGSQNITFVQPPTVNAGADQTVCAYPVPTVNLAGSVVGGTGYSWSSAGGGTFSSTTSLTPTYTPSASEISAGKATLTLTATSTAPCVTTTDQVVFNITPQAKINSSSTVATCSGQALNYDITADHSGTNFTWTATVTTGTASGFSATGSGNQITDIIITTGTTDAVVTYTINPTYNSCPGIPFTLQVTVHPLPSVTANAPSPVCSNVTGNATITLSSNVANTSYSWTSSAPAGVTGNSTQSTPILVNNIVDKLVNNNTTPANVIYTITPYNGSCPGTPVITTVTVEPSPITANAGPAQELCNTTSATLHANDPSPQTGLWTQVSGPTAGTAFSAVNDPNATVSGLTPGNIYQFQWTITASASCPTSSSTVLVTIDSPPVGGTATANPAEVCSGSGSQITLSGQTGNIVQWESSINGTTWTAIPNTTATLVIPSLTQTTRYRALIHNGAACTDVYSTIATVTVDLPPTIANAGPSNEICYSSSYQLSGNQPVVGTGLWSQISGPSAVFSSYTSPTATITPSGPGVYQFQWTITASANCPPSSSIVTITVDAPPAGTANATPAEICLGSNSAISLSNQTGSVVQWESSTDGLNWTIINNTTTTITTPALTQTTQYRAKLHNTPSCPDSYSTIAIVTVDQPPPTANAGPDDEVCSQTSYNLNATAVTLPNKGTWSMVTGPSLPTFTDPTDPKTKVNNLVAGVYTFRWTITNTAACPATHDDVTITIDKAPVGGTTSGEVTVCAGGNNGQIHLAGQFGLVTRWEFSVDNGNTWHSIANTTTVQNYTNLTQTTQYRALLRNSVTCPDAYSTPTTITVNPQTPIADAGPNYNLCNQYSTILKGNDPGTFTGVWTQTGGPAVTIADPNNYTTSVTGMTGGNIYKFTWTIKGLPPCGDTFSTITIGVSSDIKPSFTMDQSKGCGPLVVSFTNTSTPTLTGTFVWNFGDGSPPVTAVNPPVHTFQPSNDGTEAIYEVTLIPTSNCGSQVPYVAYVKVSPQKPVANFNPAQTSACGTFTLSAHNLSPGDNAQYDFYLKDANGNIVQHLTYPDTRDAVFQPMTVTQQTYFSMYLVVIDKCGNQVTSPSINIPVSPSSLTSKVQIKGDVNSVCIGSPVTFQNISSGGDRFTITIYDSNKNVIQTIPAGIGDMNYTPTATGVYYVSVTAGNAGCGDAPVSALKQFTVYPIPAPGFTWTADQNFNVTFNNTTPGVTSIPASSLTYKWDFGDGSAFDASYIPAVHHFDFSKAPFTVTLTATTPGTDCSAVTSQSINITFKGNLFLPNAFIPASSDRSLNTFIAKGFGIKTWHMQIFNNFGQLVWETTKLDSNGSPVEGWDGTYKGRIVEQGVYIWQISAMLLNGEEWKGMSYRNSSPSKTGAIHLIR